MADEPTTPTAMPNNSIETEYFETAIEVMRECGVSFESGIAEQELVEIENRYGLRFPPDLRVFLEGNNRREQQGRGTTGTDEIVPNL